MSRPTLIAQPDPLPPGSYPRVGSGLEFNRVSLFSDAVFAIALTLLVVALDIPRVPDGETDGPALRAALTEARPNIVGFFVGFVLMGRHWLTHHEFFSTLRSVDRRLILLNLVYLAFIAFMPFPVALLSEYERNPVALILFALVMAAVSALELAMFVWAARHGQTRYVVSARTFRTGVIVNGAPVAVMLVSIPLALVSSLLVLGLWLALMPVATYRQRRLAEDVGGGVADAGVQP